MTETGGSEEFERRLSAAERRIEEVAVDAAAARHLAASGDRDLADLTARVLANQQATEGVAVRIGHLEGRVTRLEGKVDANTAAIKANTAAINNLGVQTGERFAAIGERFAAVDRRFDAIDGSLAAIDERFAAVDRRFDAIDGRLAAVDRRFDTLEARVDEGFAELGGKLDQTAAGLDLIVKLLTPGSDPSAG